MRGFTISRPRAVGALLLLSVGLGVAYAQGESGRDLTDPVEILRRADTAAKTVKTVRYDVSFRGLLATERQVPVVEGKVLMSGWAFNKPDKFRCDGEVRQPGSSETIKITVGTNGETYFLLDHRLKRGYVGVGPAISGSMGRPVERLMMWEFVYPTPFSDEINSRSQTLRGTKKIGNEDCYEIVVAYTDTTQEAVWCFSKKDFLPRSVQRHRIMPNGKKGAEEWVLTNLVVDPNPSEDAFAFILPEGFHRIEGFAP